MVVGGGSLELKWELALKRESGRVSETKRCQVTFWASIVLVGIWHVTRLSVPTVNPIMEHHHDQLCACTVGVCFGPRISHFHPLN